MRPTPKSPAPATVVRRAQAAPTTGAAYTAANRELFWNNVMREMLSALSVMWAKRSDAPPPAGEEDMFDGRLGIITVTGQRIPIGSVFPLFACGVPQNVADRRLSMEVEFTVFQIGTPEGQSFTIPLHEIRAFHSLSDTLVETLKKASADAQAPDANGDQMPFGFAAFTSLARTHDAPEPPSPFNGPDVPPPG